MSEQSHSKRGWSPEQEAYDGAFAVPYLHRLRFTRGAFEVANPMLRNILGPEGEEAATARTLVFVDEGVAAAWPRLLEQIERYAAAHDDRLTLAAPPAVVTGGEQSKNDWSVFETVAGAISDHAICRQSYVIAVGGGAVLDSVGFAAAAAHRGVRLVRVPTTTLAQADSGVGVKNGINAFGKKNFVGTFSPPWAVVNDESFLQTLSDRDWRCGVAEAVKVALLKSERFFEQIVETVPRLCLRDEQAVIPIVRRSAWLHLHHITDGGDPFELREARPLDFGHWSAHKLEQMTRFSLRHGEAVAIGIALDALYSAVIGHLEWSDVKRIHDCLGGLGFALAHEALHDHERLLKGLDEFREHLGGRLTITLLAGIGHAVDVHEIDRTAMADAARHLATAGRSAPGSGGLAAPPGSPRLRAVPRKRAPE
jgi:3-dehydroquinate synthase